MWKAFLRGVWTMLPDLLLPAWLGVHTAEQCQFRGPFLKTRRQKESKASPKFVLLYTGPHSAEARLESVLGRGLSKLG